MMKNPRNLLIFAVLGGVVGFGLGFVAGRVSAPNPAQLELSDNAKVDMTAVLSAQQNAWNAGDIEGFMGAMRNANSCALPLAAILRSAGKRR